MSKTLVIGDTHMPFVHPNYLRFLEEVADAYQPDEIVHIGDLVDHHALARFTSDPDGLSAGHEWKATLNELKRFARVFPKVKWVLGNHDKRPFNRAFDSEIPAAFLRPLAEVYQLPKEWEVAPYFEIDGVRYIHGESAGGLSSWQNYCTKMGQSTVIGHMHSLGGVRYHRTPNGQLFSMAVGCGVDDETYAFAYGKSHPVRPILGCGLVTDGVEAEFVPMDMSERRNYRKRRHII